MDASLLSGNTFHCPLVAQEHSNVWRASLEGMARGNLFIKALVVERHHGRLVSTPIVRGGFELSGDDAQCSVLAAFQLAEPA